MDNFEYGGYSFEYNEIKHTLEVKYDDEKLLLDARNFDPDKMPEIHEHLTKYFDFKYLVDKLEEVLDKMREEYVSPQKIEETVEVCKFLIAQAYHEIEVLETTLGDENEIEEALR